MIGRSCGCDGKKTFGGIVGRGADMCSLMVREHLAIARRDGVSVGVLFCDLRSAYYRVIRELVVGGQCSAEVIRTVGKALKLSPETADELIMALDGMPLLAEAGVAPGGGSGVPK